MARQKSVASIDAEIERLKKRISAAKKRYECLCDELESLQQRREDILGQEVMRALRRSGRTYDELMTFLGKSPA